MQVIVSLIVTREAKGYFYSQTAEMLHVKHKRLKKVGLINIILFQTLIEKHTEICPIT